MLLEAAHISKRFGSRPQVLTDVSFGVEPGEFVSVIGPSGAGKTTLFRILNGTLPCDGGEVCIDGQPFSRARGRAKRAVQKRIGTESCKAWVVDYALLRTRCDVAGFEEGRVAPL